MDTVALPSRGPITFLLLAVLAFWAAVPQWALSGTTGKIAGRVVDAATGEPLPGVNVVIAGTSKGAATDLDGYYVILEVKPGNYAVRASFIGFAVQTVEGVRVQVDKTTTINFELVEEVFEGQEVVVTAERGIVEVDRTTTTAVVDSEQLEALPVTSIGDAINLQAGVVDGRFRGGRSGEVAYLVNGVPINNAFNNQAAFDVEQNMVASLEVISGVFNAEYGQALSGVVNIVTKDLPSEWSGSFLGYVGSILSSEKLEFVERVSAPGAGLASADFESRRVSYWDASDRDNLLDVQASIGGPILRDKLSLQMTGRFIRDKGHLIGRDLFAPSDSSQNLTDPESQWLIESNGSGDFEPLGWSERYSLNGSVGYKLSGAVRFEYNLFLQDGEGRGYNHQLKYVPNGINRFFFFSQTHIASLRYTIGSKSFGSVSYSYLRDKFDSRLYDLPEGYDEAFCAGLPAAERLRTENIDRCRLDAGYASPALGGLQGTNAFSVGGNDLFSNDELTTTHTILADFSSQLNRIHLAKVGVQARLHKLDNRSFGIEKSARTLNTAQVSPNVFSDNITDASPVEFSAYVQDKMEFEGLIVNAGLRFDYFDPDYDIPYVWAQASEERIINPCDPEQLADSELADCFERFSDIPDIMTADSVSNRRAADAELQLSPRLGIAFPISATGVMRFSAGMFFQIPPLSLLYTNPEFEVNTLSSSTQFGNPALNPERTLAFEIGLQQGLTDALGLELTLFTKDVRNLTGQEIVRTPNGDFAIRWVNRDYGTIRGLTFSLFQRPMGPISWTLDYTLQFADGTASDPGEAFGRQQSGQEAIIQLVRLNWDRRHVVNGTFTLKPYDGFTATLVGRLRSGEPYTTVRNFIQSSEPNNANRPWQLFSDLRVFYRPKFIKQDVQLFLQVQNLLDTRPQFAVYSDTGLADESVEKERFRDIEETTGESIVGGVNSLDEFYYRQEWLGAPRKVSVGVSYRF